MRKSVIKIFFVVLIVTVAGFGALAHVWEDAIYSIWHEGDASNEGRRDGVAWHCQGVADESCGLEPAEGTFSVTFTGCRIECAGEGVDDLVMEGRNACGFLYPGTALVPSRIQVDGQNLLNECILRNTQVRRDRARDQEAADAEARRQGCENAENEIRARMEPRPAFCRPRDDGRPHFPGCPDPTVFDMILDCAFDCYNDFVSTSINYDVFGLCDIVGRNCDLDDHDMAVGASHCLEALGDQSEGLPGYVAGAPGSEGRSGDTGISRSELYENDRDGDGDSDGAYEPPGGFEDEEAEEVAESGHEEGEGEIDGEDIPEADFEGAAGEREAEAATGYSQDDYEQEVRRRAVENLRRLGPNPTEEERRAAGYQAVADARTEINRRAATDRRGESAQAVEDGKAEAARMKNHFSLVRGQFADRSRGQALEKRATEIPRPTPDASSTASMATEKNAGLIGEGERGPTVADPVINGTFCYDKVFARENTTIGFPVEVSAKYCSYQSPSTTPSGALGPGWTLNVESHVLYYPGESSLFYQDPSGNNFHFTLDAANGGWHKPDGTFMNVTAQGLQSSCEENFGYSADFLAVGAPLLMKAKVSTEAKDCHLVVFEFELIDPSGAKSYFKRVHDLSQPYPGTKEVETRNLWSEKSTREVDPLSQLHAADLPRIDLPHYVSQARDLAGERTRKATVLESANDPGPLGMVLLSQSYTDANALPDQALEEHDAALNSSLVATGVDAGFFAGRQGKGRFVSYAIPAIVAPVVRWEDPSGNAVDIGRKTFWQKYYSARVSAKALIHNWREVGELEETRRDYRGHAYTEYSYDERKMKEVDHAVSYTLYETLIPRATLVTLRSNAVSLELDLRYQMEHDVASSGAYKTNNLFPAPIFRNQNEREDILVLRPRPVLIDVYGNTDAAFNYGFVSGEGVCNLYDNITSPPHLISYNGHMAFMGSVDPGALPQGSRHRVEGCQKEAGGILLKDAEGRDYFAGPLILTAWIPPHPVTGNAESTFDGSAMKPEYFMYEPSNPETDALQNIQYPLHYLRMTETGSLNAWPFNAPEAAALRGADRQIYLVNRYSDQNLVESQQLGDSGAVSYTYETINYDGGQRQRHITRVVTRGGVNHAFEYDGPPGRGLLKSQTINPGEAGGLPALTTQYEYAPAPAGKPHIQGRLAAVTMPDRQRLEYSYMEQGDPLDFHRYAVREISQVTPGGRRVLVSRFAYDPAGRELGFYNKVASVTGPAPLGIVGNETVTTQFRYDYQEPDLYSCNMREPQGKLVKIIYPDTTFEAWKHNIYGQPIFHRNRQGATTTFSYYGSGSACR